MWTYPYHDTDVDRPLVENPDAPRDLFAAVLNGAHAGTKPGTERFVDAEWSNNNGVLTGYTNPSTEGWEYSSELGTFGNRFDGIANYTNLGLLLNVAPQHLGNLTFVSWFRSSSASSNRMITSVLNDNLTTSYQLFFPGTNQLRIANRDSDGKRLEATSSANNKFSDNAWHLLTASHDGPENQVSMTVDAIPQPITYHSQQGPSNYGVFQYPLVLAARNNRGTIELHLACSLINTLIYPFALDQPLITWLANPNNRLYVPQTRKQFYAPLVTGWRPWHVPRQSRIIGGGIL